MVIKGTKQLGLFNRGINLYVPVQRGVIKNGLLLYLDANNIRSYGGSGNTWHDLASPSNNVTLVGSPTFTSSTPKHFSFNGSNQHGTSLGETVPSTAYTKCVWFKLGAYVDNNLVSSESGGHYMFFQGGNKMYNGHSNWAGFPSNYPSTATFSLNTWYNVALTFNTTDGMKLYINGVLDSSYTAIKTAHNGDGSTNIACYIAGGNLLNGSISMVMTYNRAITASEVLRNYEVTKSNFGY